MPKSKCVRARLSVSPAVMLPRDPILEFKFALSRGCNLIRVCEVTLVAEAGTLATTSNSNVASDADNDRRSEIGAVGRLCDSREDFARVRRLPKPDTFAAGHLPFFSGGLCRTDCDQARWARTSWSRNRSKCASTKCSKKVARTSPKIFGNDYDVLERLGTEARKGYADSRWLDSRRHAFWLVVARQHRRARVDSFPHQGRTRRNSRRMRMLLSAPNPNRMRCPTRKHRFAKC